MKTINKTIKSFYVMETVLYESAGELVIDRKNRKKNGWKIFNKFGNMVSYKRKRKLNDKKIT